MKFNTKKKIVDAAGTFGVGISVVATLVVLKTYAPQLPTIVCGIISMIPGVLGGIIGNKIATAILFRE